MNSIILVTVLALVQFVFFGALVAKARAKEQVFAPATAGSAAFNVLNRVHMNTLERLAIFLPLLWMAAQFWNPLWVSGLGAVFLAGRMLYWKGYVKSPESRSMGNVVTMLAIAGLLIATLAGLVKVALA
jgi:glutathione S-transferase